MPKITHTFCLLFLLAILPGWAQSEFQYDQQSAIEGTSGGFTFLIQARQPIGQSFTPQLDAVGFVRLSMGDPNLGNSLGATLIVNIRSGSITGPILGTSDPVVLADNFNGYPIFFSQSLSQSRLEWAIICNQLFRQAMPGLSSATIPTTTRAGCST